MGMCIYASMCDQPVCAHISPDHRSIMLRIISGVRSPFGAASGTASCTVSTPASTASTSSTTGWAATTASEPSGSFFTMMFSMAPVLSSSTWIMAAAARRSREDHLV